MRHRLAVAVARVAVAATAALPAGCSLVAGVPASNPGPGSVSRQTTTPTQARSSPNEIPSPRPAAEHAPGAPSPAAALRGFARAYINWSWRDVSARMNMLARASIGQARSEMQLAAAATARDSTLTLGGISNRGTVEAVAPVLGRPGRFVVVTREATSATRTSAYQGLAPAWHVTVATVVQLAAGAGPRWVISGWQPEG